MLDESRKQKVIDIVSDTIGRMLYYDRKEDDDMPVGAIEQAVLRGDISADEIVSVFRRHLQTAIALEAHLSGPEARL